MEWILVALGIIAWGWYSGTVAKEAAVKAARRLCERNGQQLLDETVALHGMRPQRTPSGRLGLLRRYVFEFSSEGDERRRGWITLLAGRIVAAGLELEEGALLEQPSDEPPRTLH